MNKPHSALLVIDMQNEFLFENGIFGKQHIHLDSLVEGMTALNKKIRTSTDFIPIYWIYSNYEHQLKRPHKRLQLSGNYVTSPLSDFLSGSHFGKRPCCEADSWESKFPSSVQALIDPTRDSIICKQWYSVFTETNLQSHLQAKKIKQLWITGVTTNVCIMATCRDAFSLGYDVKLISDCTAAASYERHNKSLLTIEKNYGQLITSTNILHTI
jgi:nicotinamidase-related amidase